MRNVQKKLIILFAAILTFSLLASLIAPLLAARADTVTQLEDKLKEAQRSRAAAEAGLAEVEGEITNAEAKRKSLDEDISALETELYTLSLQIAENEENISLLEADLTEAVEAAADYEDSFKERVRVMYERSDVSFLNILFGAENFSDLLKRVETVSRIVEYDRSVLDRMAENQAQIETKKTALEDTNAAVELSRDIQAAKKAELDANRAALTTVIAELESDEDSYRATLDAADAAEEALRAEIRALTQTQTPAKAPAETNQVTDSGGRFCWPTPSTTYVTSPFGTRFHPVQKRYKTHTGIDIGAGSGASIVSAESGTVLRAGWNSGYGNYVVVDHGGGVQTLYGHCSALLVSAGQSVSRGEQIALVGSTGVSTGPHLHFEVLINGEYTDPMAYFG
ncbi:MAG: peptidoglycan DD-metalloendopeptidase family protein [Clostridia bacterium]|nr:peptidoglycan DD-metalloendopeptidase family protein [Clostridia bacterium]